MYSRSHTTWSFFLQLRLFHVALRSGGLKAVQVEIRQTDVLYNIFFFLFGPLTCFFNLFQLHFSSYSSVHVTLKSFSRLGRYSVFFSLFLPLSKEIFPSWPMTIRIKREFNMPNVLLLLFLLLRFRCISTTFSSVPH